MENPATWKEPEVIILNAWEDWNEAQRAGMVGPSIARVIADRLRKAGWLHDEDSPELGWVKLRELRNKHPGGRSEQHAEDVAGTNRPGDTSAG